jgi:hypothetical protein
MTDIHTPLTIEEIEQLNNWLKAADVGSMAVERPVVPSSVNVGSKGVAIGAEARLGRATRSAYEKKAAKAVRRKAAIKKRKLPKGQFHHKSKEATKRRAAQKRWIIQPLKSLCYGYGSWAISQEEWDSKLGVFWTLYNPLDLTVKRRWGYGTKAQPYTIYDIKLVHKKHGVLYSGQDQLIYDSSKPNALDIEKAPEGAVVFEELALDTKAIQKKLSVEAMIARLQLALPSSVRARST